MVVSIVGPIDDNHVQRVLLVAAYAGIKLKHVQATEGKENATESFRLNCHPMQRFPIMKTDEGYLFDTAAMIRYLGRTEVLMIANGEDRIPHPQYPVPYAVYGHALVESAQVDQWLDFASSRLDVYTERLIAGGSRDDTHNAKSELFKHLDALERRLQFIRSVRKQAVQQSGGALTARGYLDEDFLMDDSQQQQQQQRGGRLTNVYNVAGSIRSRQDEDERAEKEKKIDAIKQQTDSMLDGGDSVSAHSHSHHNTSTGTARLSAIMHSARCGSLSARGSLGAGPSVIQRHDLHFLVGDSLTAADLVLCMALHLVFSATPIADEAVRTFAGCHKYYKSVMMLPVATEMRKVLRVSLV